jgi:hypothetical protein
MNRCAPPCLIYRLRWDLATFKVAGIRGLGHCIWFSFSS